MRKITARYLIPLGKTRSENCWGISYKLFHHWHSYCDNDGRHFLKKKLKECVTKDDVLLSLFSRPAFLGLNVETTANLAFPLKKTAPELSRDALYILKWMPLHATEWIILPSVSDIFLTKI